MWIHRVPFTAHNHLTQGHGSHHFLMEKNCIYMEKNLHFLLKVIIWFIKMETTGVQCWFGQYVKNVVKARFGNKKEFCWLK